MARVQSRAEFALRRVLPGPEIVPSRLHAAMRYAVLGGGKRVRPLLVHAAGEASPKNLDESDLQRYCKDNFTAYKRPKTIEFRDDLPKSNVGKILRRELRAGS